MVDAALGGGGLFGDVHVEAAELDPVQRSRRRLRKSPSHQKSMNPSKKKTRPFHLASFAVVLLNLSKKSMFFGFFFLGFERVLMTLTE